MEQHIPWGAGAPIPHTPFREVIAPALVDDHLVMLAVDMPVGEHVPEHTHDDEDQIMVVIDGTVGAVVDGEHHALGAGSVLVMPRGLPHALWNAGDAPAKVLELYTPPGMEQRFRTAGLRPFA